MKFCIYGHNRVGKTTLACQFPKPLLLISFEPAKSGGATSVVTVPDVTFIHLDNSLDASNLARELKGDTYYKSHVLDTASSFQDIILKELLNLPEIPDTLLWGTVSEDQYKRRSEKLKQHLRPFLSLNAHTVILAKEKDHNPPKGERNTRLLKKGQTESLFGPDMGTATAGWVNDACDYVCQLFVEEEVSEQKQEIEIEGNKVTEIIQTPTGREIRKLRTTKHDNFMAGFRSSNPKMVPRFITQPSFERILAVIQGKRWEDIPERKW